MTGKETSFVFDTRNITLLLAWRHDTGVCGRKCHHNSLLHSAMNIGTIIERHRNNIKVTEQNVTVFNLVSIKGTADRSQEVQWGKVKGKGDAAKRLGFQF